MAGDRSTSYKALFDAFVLVAGVDPDPRSWPAEVIERWRTAYADWDAARD